jgi:tetratricopeptide (TPR) repeat protein
MSRPLLTASLIAKNEEKFLGACLESLHGIVDEIVIVDTGSTDRTKQIAADHGAYVFDFPWTGDFSAARNQALQISNGEWILYIDADERVQLDSASCLRAALLDESRIAYEVLLYPRPGHTPYWILRLFRNHPSIRFCGIIHENLWPAVMHYHSRHGGNVGRSKLVLEHGGYEGDQKAKNDRNFPLLLRSLEQDPSRIYSWCHLATIYLARNQRELAEEAWQKALGVVRAGRGQPNDDILPYLGLIETGMENGCEVSGLLKEAVARFGSRVQLQWLTGRMLMRAGNFAEALPVFESLIAQGRRGDYDCLASYDLKLFTVYAYEAIATCHFRLGNYGESRQYFDLAAQCEPGRLEYRVKRALSQRLGSLPARSSESA